MRARAVHLDAMNAMADLGVRVRDVLGLKSAVDGAPRLAGIVGPEHARSHHCDEEPTSVGRIQKDRAQAHRSPTRLPAPSRVVGAQSAEFLPVLSAIG